VRGPTAIDRQRDASNRRCSIGRKKDRKSAELIHRGELLVWLLREQNFLDDALAWNVMSFGLIIYLRFNQRRVDIAWANRITGDALFCGFERRHFRQAYYAVLRRDIGRFERRRDEAVRRGDIDDAAPAVLHHTRQR
jgi:hypothetical protein